MLHNLSTGNIVQTYQNSTEKQSLEHSAAARVSLNNIEESSKSCTTNIQANKTFATQQRDLLPHEQCIIVNKVVMERC